MRVAALQKFIKNLAELVYESQGKKTPAEVDKVCRALDPFQEHDLGKFADFLAAVADEFQRSGAVALPTAKAARAGKSAGAKPPKPKGKNDVDAIRLAAARMKDLYERATDPAVAPDTIQAEVAQVDREFDKDGLIAVAREFGILDRPKSKKDAKEKILKRIAERKSSYERMQTISRPLE